jgi:hypothetical protein
VGFFFLLAALADPTRPRVRSATLPEAGEGAKLFYAFKIFSYFTISYEFDFMKCMAKLHIGSRIAPPVLSPMIHHVMRSEHEKRNLGIGRSNRSGRAS